MAPWRVNRAVLRAGIVAVSLLGVVRPPDAARAQNGDEKFYAGRQMVLLIAATAGGGYDRWGRLVGRHIGRHIPGAPQIVNQNMGAAGGVAGTAHLFNVMARDGSVFGLITRDAPLAPIMHPSQARYDPAKLNWIGSTTTETSVCISRGSSPVKTLSDLMQRELIVGDTGAGTGTYVYPRALNGLFGTKFKIVSGFQNSVDVFLALERGEVDGICESLDSVSGKSPGWREKGVFNAVLHGGLEPDPHLEGVPFVFELAKNEEDRQALRFLYAGQAIGRPFVMPPDVPKSRVELMRKAFAATMKDPEFLAEAGKMKLDVDPVSGEKLEAVIGDLVATPRSVIDRVGQFMK